MFNFIVISLAFSGLIIAMLTLKVSVSFPQRGQPWFHINQLALSPYRVLICSAIIMIFAATISNDLKMEFPQFNFHLPGISLPKVTNSAVDPLSSSSSSPTTPPIAPDIENEATVNDDSLASEEIGSTSPSSTESESISTGETETAITGGRQGREPDWARDP
ncbi:hypothetical protein KJ836_03350 [Patescibacteria group bacterium]|nr:hypothetical protein [Patescibacteria group bacterium]